MPASASPGRVLAAMLHDTLRAYRLGPVVGDRTRQIIYGATSQGTFVGGMTADGFLARAGRVLLDSGRFYRFGNTIVYETDGPGDQRLTTLALQHRAEPHAAGALANLVGIGVEGDAGITQSLLPTKLVNAVLADEGLWRRLPEIRYHARRPTFDLDYNLCRPGWNAAAGILVHTPDIVPAMTAPAYAPNARAIDRLPRRLKGLLGEFAWRTDADLVNALSMLLTGLLINHFVDDPHPGGIVDANQAGTGKTLLVQVIGRVLDDAEPPRIALVRDEEVEKKLCAQLRSSRTSLFFLDNVRTRIESAVIEQNMLSPLLSFRVLGRSATIERPNTNLWMITSNMTAGTPDFIRRCVPIRQFYEGDPKGRLFSGDPLEYVARHRLEILGELAGLVLRWVEQGKPPGQQRHRCKPWAATIGGILDANGLGEFFLANSEEAEAAMDQGLLDLATLAEHVVAKGPADLHVRAGEDMRQKGSPPGQWLPVFAATQVLRDKLAEGTTQGRATAVGIFLGSKINRTVPIETADGPRRATLRRRDASAGQKLYYFETAVPTTNNDQAAQPAVAAVAGAAPTSNGHGPAAAAARTPAVGDAGEGPPAPSPPPAAALPAPAGSNGHPGGGELEWL